MWKIDIYIYIAMIIGSKSVQKSWHCEFQVHSLYLLGKIRSDKFFGIVRITVFQDLLWYAFKCIIKLYWNMLEAWLEICRFWKCFCPQRNLDLPNSITWQTKTYLTLHVILKGRPFIQQSSSLYLFFDMRLCFKNHVKNLNIFKFFHWNYQSCCKYKIRFSNSLGYDIVLAFKDKLIVAQSQTSKIESRK